jgi:hypothetical protein
MLRQSILIAFAFASIAFNAQAANAKDKDLGKQSQTRVEGICGEKGGTYFSNPEGTNYGCGYKGGGGILCDKDTGCLETTRTQEPSDKPWGLIGLLGLAGLLGLSGRNRDVRGVPAA